MKCIIADDEQLARKGIENFVQKVSFLDLISTCSSAAQVEEQIQKQKVDLLFLDIQMPGMTGIELLKKNKNLPITIITTAFPNYALESFELEVMDYLVKPVPFERFQKAVNKAREYFEIKKNALSAKNDEIDYFFIKTDKQYEKIFLDEITIVEAMQNYVLIHTDKKRLLTYVTLKNVEEYLPESRFIKVNKSCIVSMPKIDRIVGNELKIGPHSITIGRSIKEGVLDALLKNKLLKR